MGLNNQIVPENQEVIDSELQNFDNKDNVTFSALCRNLLENTSAHGIPNSAKSNSIVKRIFWISLVLGFLAALTYHIYYVTAYYMTYPTYVSLTLEQGDQLPFPAVTICNMSPVRKSKWEGGTRRRRKKRSTGCSTGVVCVDSCDGIPDGQYQDCASCQQYITCTSSSPSFSPCPGTTNWNDNNKGCNNGPSATCTDTTDCATTYSAPELTSAYWSTNGVMTSESITTSDDMTSQAVGPMMTSLTHTTESTYETVEMTIQPRTFGPTTGPNVLTTLKAMASTDVTSAAVTSSAAAPTDVASAAVTSSAAAPTDVTSAVVTSADVAATVITSVVVTSVNDVTTDSFGTTLMGPPKEQTTEDYVFYSDDSPILTTSEAPTCSCCCDGSPVVLDPVSFPSTSPIEEEPKSENSTSPLPELREEYVSSEVMLEELASVSESVRESLGTTLDELILDCQYQGSTCQTSDFQRFSNPVHGNCYIFNSGWNGTRSNSTRTGPRYGLQLVLNIDQDEYVSDAGDTAGIRVLAHPGDVMPFPEDVGVTLEPGQHSYVSIVQTDIDKVGSPYSTCTYGADPEVDLDVYTEGFPVKYSLHGCQKTCIQREIVARCGCASSGYPTSGRSINVTDDVNHDVTICSVTNATQQLCIYDIQDKIEAGDILCGCREPCRSTFYDTKVSSSLWPSDDAKTYLFDRFASVVPQIFNDASDPKKYSRNLMKVTLYYKELNHQLLQELPAYKLGNFASDLGGLLGLWFGFTVFTLFEFVEFILDGFKILFIYCSKQCTRENKHPKAPRVVSKELLNQFDRKELYAATQKQRKLSSRSSRWDKIKMKKNDKYVYGSRAPLPPITPSPRGSISRPAPEAMEPPSPQPGTSGRVTPLPEIPRSPQPGPSGRVTPLPEIPRSPQPCPSRRMTPLPAVHIRTATSYPDVVPRYQNQAGTVTMETSGSVTRINIATSDPEDGGDDVIATATTSLSDPMTSRDVTVDIEPADDPDVKEKKSFRSLIKKHFAIPPLARRRRRARPEVTGVTQITQDKSRVADTTHDDPIPTVSEARHEDTVPALPALYQEPSRPRPKLSHKLSLFAVHPVFGRKTFDDTPEEVSVPKEPGTSEEDIYKHRPRNKSKVDWSVVADVLPPDVSVTSPSHGTSRGTTRMRPFIYSKSEADFFKRLRASGDDDITEFDFGKLERMPDLDQGRRNAFRDLDRKRQDSEESDITDLLCDNSMRSSTHARDKRRRHDVVSQLFDKATESRWPRSKNAFEKT